MAHLHSSTSSHGRRRFSTGGRAHSTAPRLRSPSAIQILAASMTGGTTEARVLAERVSDAWINFARKGDPQYSGLPKWPAFSPDKSPTMVFDNKCEVRNNHDGEERKAVVG